MTRARHLGWLARVAPVFVAPMLVALGLLATPGSTHASHAFSPVQDPVVTSDDPPVQEPPPKPEPAPAPTPAPTPTPAPAGGDPTPVATPPTGSAAAATASDTPAPAVTFDYAARANHESYQAEIARLVAAHPTRARRVSLGTSRGGRDITALVLSDLSVGDPDRKPAVLLVTGLDPSFDARPAGCEAALFAARAILQRAESDAAAAAWLARTSVYVLPAPDPDLLFAPEGAPPRACRLDRNFPCAWRPWSSETCAQGPYPLSEPETRALAQFLAARGNVGAVVLLSRGKDLAPATVDAQVELDRILFERVAAVEAGASRDGAIDAKAAAETLARRAESFARESGSLAAFCRSRLSAFVLPLDPFGGETVDTPFGRAPQRFARVAEVVARLSDELPRVEGTVTGTERLRERLWKIDLVVENQGLLPTLLEAERAQSPGSLWFDATGGRIAQVGVSRGGAGDTNARMRPPASWLLGHLDGREKIKVFVLIEAAEGTNVEFTLRTLREGETRCAVTLH